MSEALFHPYQPENKGLKPKVYMSEALFHPYQPGGIRVPTLINLEHKGIRAPPLSTCSYCLIVNHFKYFNCLIVKKKMTKKNVHNT
jgi:hypothetical protein